jgi:uncharacterized RDD family membrane protein YckC
LKPNPSTLQIRTPEGVDFSLPLASPALRGIAVFIDAMFLAALARVCAAVAQGFRWVSPDFAGAAMTLAYFLLSFAYSIALEWRWHGQTVGKRLLNLRVVDARGLRLTFPQIVVRNLLRAFDALPFFYAVGGLAAWISPRRQRLGDLAADTVVIVLAPQAVPDAAALTAGHWNSFRAYPRLEARLRQSVGPEEATLLFRALARREELDPSARLALYRDLAASLRERVPFPPEVAEDLADEQYLRNVLDTLFRK